MVNFVKLGLSGFKSFPEATELSVEPGLTGIVGPNGCGKSNVVEALRWVMGETSAKQMRGGGMDDVIFNGTANRPARNNAEVKIFLDNRDRGVTASFNDYDELEIVRRIERGEGSAYRVNGKDVRARDVQLLFADLATGARSTALVSQGRIGAVIQAKPVDRRSLLEEAANISGLHSRRHEAELRLRGAETNLERLDDVLETLEAQRANLKKQARQANRYRNLNDHIRKAQATLLYIRWFKAVTQLDAAQEALSEAQQKVNALTGEVSKVSAAQADKAAKLPDLRKSEAEAASAFHRLEVEAQNLEAEERRLEDVKRDLENRKKQTEDDVTRESERITEAETVLKTLQDERARLSDLQQKEAELEWQAAQRLGEAREKVQEIEKQVNTLTEDVAAAEGRRSGFERRISDLTERQERLENRLEDIARQREELDGAGVAQEDLHEAESAVEHARTELDAVNEEYEAAQDAREKSDGALNEARALLADAEKALAKLQAEEKALADIVESNSGGDWPGIIQSITVDAGMETALGAALGETLNAPAEEASPVHWRGLPPFDAPSDLPGGAQALSEVVQAPAELSRRLSQVGLVADRQTGDGMMAQLKQGQCLVSRAGDFWRWDGYFAAAEAPTAAAVHLQQRNRLADLRAQLADFEAKVNAARTEVEDAGKVHARAVENEGALQARVREKEDAVAEARDGLAEIRQDAAQYQSRLRALEETAEQVSGDLNEVSTQLQETREALSNLPQTDEGRSRLEALRLEAEQARSAQMEALSAHDRLKSEADARKTRLGGINQDMESWSARRAAAERQVEALNTRLAGIEKEIDELAERPEEIREKRNALLTQVEEASTRRKAAGDALAEAEQELAEADTAVKAAEGRLSEAREGRVRAEANVEQASQQRDSIVEQMQERLNLAPEGAQELAGLDPESDLPDFEAADKKLQRLISERENMGPVNLRAEQEMEELDQQVEGLTTERTDLLEAIDRLRKGISELNREGRQRLLASFKEVDHHFQGLFKRLFGGGEAHLALTESDDPLEAGLEIMASPPGKKMQVLSLLSGGEQALTALALLFAVFMTNPAPICVLDEVDAPLDDANVDRFCNLLSEIAHSGTTRFLVVTHHRMTMARMDRLFGVTMAERGVSQLVSVDLQQAEEMRKTA